VARRRDVFVVDVLDLWTDLSVSSQIQPPGGTSPSAGSYTVDGLHPSGLGAFVLGMREADILSRIAPPCPRLWSPRAGTYDAAANPRGNLVANAMMAGAADGYLSAGVSGAVPHGWAAIRYSGAAVTATASKATPTLANGLPQAMAQLAVSNPGGAAQSVLLY
jgi:hypothetical protein